MLKLTIFNVIAVKYLTVNRQKAIFLAVNRLNVHSGFFWFQVKTILSAKISEL